MKIPALVLDLKDYNVWSHRVFASELEPASEVQEVQVSYMPYGRAGFDVDQVVEEVEVVFGDVKMISKGLRQIEELLVIPDVRGLVLGFGRILRVRVEAGER